MENSQMVIADKYQLLEPINQSQQIYNEKGSKKHLGRKAVLRSFVDERNQHKNNELYIIDEEATKEFYEKREAQIILNKQREAKEKLSQADLIDLMIAGKSNNDNSELEDLRLEYKEKFGKNASKVWGIKKLTSLLNEN